MPHKPSFSKDDFFKIEESWFAPHPPGVTPNPFQDALRASIQKRKRFGMELPKLDTSLFGKS